MLLDERITAEGVRSCTWIACDGSHVQIRDADGVVGVLPVAALDRIMARYGRPLDSEIAVEGESVSCGGGTLRRLRYRAAVDAEARDYLVWECPGQEPLAALAITVTAALRFLIVRLSPGAVLSTTGDPDPDDSSQ